MRGLAGSTQRKDMFFLYKQQIVSKIFFGREKDHLFVASAETLIYLFADGSAKAQRIGDVTIGIGSASGSYDHRSEVENSSPERFSESDGFGFVQLQFDNAATIRPNLKITRLLVTTYSA